MKLYITVELTGEYNAEMAEADLRTLAAALKNMTNAPLWSWGDLVQVNTQLIRRGEYRECVI